jgi:hypothetical protein
MGQMPDCVIRDFVGDSSIGDELIHTPIIFDCTNKRTCFKHVARLNRERFSQSHAATATTRYIARKLAVFTVKTATFGERGSLASVRNAARRLEDFAMRGCARAGRASSTLRFVADGDSLRMVKGFVTDRFRGPRGVTAMPDSPSNRYKHSRERGSASFGHNHV